MRSWTKEMSVGMIDGTYKKVIRDRGGLVDPATEQARMDLDDRYYGIHEKAVKVMPDGVTEVTPYFVPTPVVDLERD